MTRKHKLYFYFWKLYQRLRGFGIGTIVKIYSQSKGKYIKGCISSISGDSITNSPYDFYFGVNLFEPIQGNDSTSYMWGSYSPRDLKYNIADGIFYNKKE